jgi:WD40 repeat protein
MTPSDLLPAAPVPHPSPSVPPLVRIFGELHLQGGGGLLALAFSSPDVLSSVEEPGVLRQWSLSTGRAVASTFLSDLETLWTFSSDGRALVTASDEVSIWDVDSGELITTLVMPSWVTAIGVHRTPAMIATGHDEGVVRLWDPAGHRLIRELAGHDRPIGAVTFSPDGRCIASAAEDRVICLWDVGSGRQIGTLQRHSDRIGGLAWHPQGRLLVSAGWDRTARVWDTETLEPVILLNTHADQVIALAVSPDGASLACADSAPSVHIWDLNTFKELHVLNDFKEEVHCLAFGPDSRLLAGGRAEGAIDLWDAREGRLLSPSHGTASHRISLSVSACGSRLTSASRQFGSRTWDIATGELAHRETGNGLIDHFATSPNGKWIAMSRGCGVELRDARGGALSATFACQREVSALTFAPDSLTLASATEDGAVWLWTVPTGRQIFSIPSAADGCTIESLSFAPTGHVLAVGGIDWMATGGSDGAVCLWDLRNRELVANFDRGTRALGFHPSGRCLATASLENTIHLWDLTAKTLARSLVGHGDAVLYVCFSPDGRWLASGGQDRTVRIWDGETGKLTVTHSADTTVKALAFSPDGRFLFTGNGNTTCSQLDFSWLLEEGVS